MNKKVNRNIKGLLTHSSNLKKDTEERVITAIEQLKRKKTKINFKTVSEVSGVSKTTLYNNKLLRARIESLRAVKKSEPKTNNTDISNQKKLREEIKKLREEKQMLIVQLLTMEQLQDENIKLKKLLSQRNNE